MSLWLETILATLCVLGLAGGAWWLLGRFLKPLSDEGAQVLLAGRKSGAGLEQTVRGFVWLRGLGILNCPIVIVDVDLDRRGRERAHGLAGRWPAVSVWPLAHVSYELEHLYQEK